MVPRKEIYLSPGEEVDQGWQIPSRDYTPACASGVPTQALHTAWLTSGWEPGLMAAGVPNEEFVDNSLYLRPLGAGYEW